MDVVSTSRRDGVHRPERPPGTLRIGQIAGVDVLVRASWFIVAALIAIMLAPRINLVAPGLGGLVYVAGVAFAILLYLSVLLHEISHALMAKSFGFEVRSVTLHFLGGVTEIEGESDTAWREFWISVVGPITSLAVAAAAWGGALVTPPGLLLFAFEALAYANLVVGVLNLLPGLPLDGGHVLRALVWGVTGNALRATVVAAWGGRVLAVLALTYPYLISAVWGQRATLYDYAIALIIAFFLWTAASASLATVKVRRKLPSLQARGLARRAVSVPEDLPLAEAVRRAREEHAGGIVVLDRRDGSPSGVVEEAAVAATPQERQPWVSVGSLARHLDEGNTLQVGLAGEDLVRAMQDSPAPAYVLIEPDGSVYGVLDATDVDRAFAEA